MHWGEVRATTTEERQAAPAPSSSTQVPDAILRRLTEWYPKEVWPELFVLACEAISGLGPDHWDWWLGLDAGSALGLLRELQPELPLPPVQDLSQGQPGQAGLDLLTHAQDTGGSHSQHTSAPQPALASSSARSGHGTTPPPNGPQQPAGAVHRPTPPVRHSRWREVMRMAWYPFGFIVGSMCLMIGGTILPRGSLPSIILVVVGAVLAIPYATYNGVKTLAEVPGFLRRLRDTVQPQDAGSNVEAGSAAARASALGPAAASRAAPAISHPLSTVELHQPVLPSPPLPITPVTGPGLAPGISAAAAAGLHAGMGILPRTTASPDAWQSRVPVTAPRPAPPAITRSLLCCTAVHVFTDPSREVAAAATMSQYPVNLQQLQHQEAGGRAVSLYNQPPNQQQVQEGLGSVSTRPVTHAQSHTPFHPSGAGVDQQLVPPRFIDLSESTSRTGLQGTVQAGLRDQSGAAPLPALMGMQPTSSAMGVGAWEAASPSITMLQRQQPRLHTTSYLSSSFLPSPSPSAQPTTSGLPAQADRSYLGGLASGGDDASTSLARHGGVSASHLVGGLHVASDSVGTSSHPTRTAGAVLDAPPDLLNFSPDAARLAPLRVGCPPVSVSPPDYGAMTD